VQHHLAKVNYNYYFDETLFLYGTVFFQFNKRLEFDVEGISMRLLLDLALTTNAVNIDYKKSLHDWNIKTGVNGSFQNNFANQPRIKPLIPNFNRVEFGLMG
jgi:iron complex outermembrane receptor protein